MKFKLLFTMMLLTVIAAVISFLYLANDSDRLRSANPEKGISNNVKHESVIKDLTSIPPKSDSEDEISRDPDDTIESLAVEVRDIKIKNELSQNSVVNTKEVEVVNDTKKNKQDSKKKNEPVGVRLNFVNQDVSKFPDKIGALYSQKKDRSSGWGRSSIEKNRDGFFYFKFGKTNNFLNLHVNGYGYARDIFVPKRGVEEIDVYLIKGESVKILIVDKDNNPLSNVAVSLAYKDDMSVAGIQYISFGVKSISDQRGFAFLTGLTKGKYKVVCSREKYLESNNSIEVINDKVVSLKVILELGYTIRGYVVDENHNPVPFAELDIQEQTPGLGYSYWSSPNSFSADDKGIFHYDGLKKSNYFISGKKKGVGYIKNLSIDINEISVDNKIELMLTPGLKIKGKIVNQQTGNPVDKMWVILNKAKKKSQYGFVRLSSSGNSMKTDKNGLFEFEFLSNINYELSLMDSEYRFIGEPRPIVVGGDHNLELKVEEVSTVTFQVLLKNDEIAKDYRVLIKYSQSKGPYFSAVSANKNGVGKIILEEDIKNALDIQLIISKPGYEVFISKAYNFESLSTELLKFVLKEKKKVLFNVIGYKIKSISKIEYIAIPIKEDDQLFFDSNRINKIASVDNNGQISAEELHNKSYKLIFKTKEYAPLILNFVQDDSLAFDLDFKKGNSVSGVVYDHLNRFVPNKKILLKKKKVIMI
ncbi:MAG: hypothetical protein COA79_11665 [Planctomycetota bacterium]|nr:MAG: hypothetical protein COA79_11665 [Planctomycetota bacterium]